MIDERALVEDQTNSALGGSDIAHEWSNRFDLTGWAAGLFGGIVSNND